MRIALFSDNFYPELSGISDSLISLAEELAARGHQIHFYVPKYAPEDYSKARQPYRELDLGPNVAFTRFAGIPFKTGTGQAHGVIPDGLRHAAVCDFNPDVIHTQTFYGLGVEALIESRRLRVPLVGTNHTAVREFLRYMPVKSEWTDNLVLKYVNWYYSQCVTVTAPSQSVFREMKESGFKKEGIALSNPIATEVFKPLRDKAALRKKWRVGNSAIIHAGRLANERSIDVMIRALPLVQKEIPEAELVLAGRGADEQELRGLAESLKVGGSVKFLGFIDQPHLVEVMNVGKVFAITSTADTQSMVMMQAMACGIPIVGVNARALPEYINASNGFVVEPGDAAALARKLIEVLRNPALRKKLGAGGRKMAVQFSPPAIAERWEEIYKGAIRKFKER
ncbi:MAG: glycosyltransferase [Patescibacteria group bacterium]|nr:glycosyltransferase [Patescibacteria group bacterium]